jgi:hypothetical protein
MSGEGEYTFADGAIFRGVFKNNERTDQGQLILPNG